MFRILFMNYKKTSVYAAAITLPFFAVFFLSLSASAQQQGPITPPPTPSYGAPAAPPVRPADPVAPKSAQRDQTAEITHEPPAIPVDQVITRFAAREEEFKRERENYTYTQTFIIQTIDYDGRADGEYRMTSDITFSPAGKRYEKVTDAPPNTLQRMSLSQQDLDDVEHVQPFVLTTNELPKYDVTYVGHQQLDELHTYVFDVGPKRLEKNQRYFQGRIWVDEKDLGIVKTDGKAVPDIRKKNSENLFPRFETFRENIEGHFWFPTYTRSNDTLHFTSGDIRIHMAIRYADYKRFGSTIKIGAPIQIDKPQP